MKRPSLSAAAALLALAGAASAEAHDPAACILTGAGEPLSEAPVDLGQGFVAQSFTEAAREDLPVPFVTITECESGILIVATRPEANGVRAEVEAVIGVMQEALASEEAETGDEIVTRLLEVGSIAQMRESASETCGCAAFYPDAIGDKTPWQPEG